MQLSAAEGEETVITVNCPDQAGLGCDLCRTILEFGLRITRGGTRAPGLFSFPRFRSLDRIRFAHTRLPSCDCELSSLDRLRSKNYFF
jgi:hypothetical protein